MKLIAFLAFFIAFGTVHAQKLCEKTSIYFDLDQSILTEQSIETLNNLTKNFQGTEYLIELYGFADSTASKEYNLLLSQKRIDSVKVFLNKIKSVNFHYFETNLGEEDNADVKDLARSRRVDIFVLPVKDGKIELEDGKATVSVPLDYFSPCGACQLKPRIDAYYTAEEARAANIEFETNDGVPLISAGSFDFNFKPCDGKEREKELICFNVRSDKVDQEMLLWEPDTINGIIYWKPIEIKPRFDMINNTYQFCVYSLFVNVDKRRFIKPLYIFPDELDQLRSEFTNSQTSIQKSFLDTASCVNFEYLSSYGVIGNTHYHYKKHSQHIPITKRNFLVIEIDSFPISYEHTIPLDKYEQLIFSESDTTLMVKLKNKPLHVGYYLKDVHQFIPFERNEKAIRFYGQKPTGEFQLAYMKKNGRVYVLPQNKMKLKYKRLRKHFRLKLRIKNIEFYKQDKEYPTKKVEWEEARKDQ